MRLDGVADDSWRHPDRYWPALDRATAELDPPFATLSTPALMHNAHDLIRRARGLPIRVVTKSVRSRGVLDAVLALPGFRGVLAYTLAEALWLAETIDDVVVGYPTLDRAALARLVSDAVAASRITIMVDSVEQLDAVDAVVAPDRRAVVRVCLDLDASWRSPIFGHVGVLRSPVHSAADARALAAAIASRRGFALVGVLSYEAQIAGVVNRPAGRPFRGAAIDLMQARSAEELRRRRGAAVAAVREVAELEFVNGGGTGSLESTAADPAVTELAAGSGLLGPHLFDGYSRFRPAPAAAFALPVVRKPTPGTATLLGGGWIASGPVGVDRVPQLAWPRGLRFVAREMAGEVQSPVTGAAAAGLQIGDRVWLRHTKAGELSEHVAEFLVVEGETIVERMPTYRGEGKAFL